MTLPDSETLSMSYQDCLGPGERWGCLTKSMNVLSHQVRDYFPRVFLGSHHRKATISPILTEITAVS